MDLYVALATLTKVVFHQFGDALPLDQGDAQAVREIMDPSVPADMERAVTVADIVLSEFMLVDIDNQWKSENAELWRNIADKFHVNVGPPGNWSPDLSLGSIIIYLGV
jgi:hypothetical protein